MLDSIIALGLIVITTGLIFVFALPQTGSRRNFRRLAAFDRLRQAIGLAVENGTRIHISLGKAGLVRSPSASGLAGLATLERIAQVSSVSDRPPLASSGEGTLAILSQDTLKAAYRQANALENYDPDRGQLVGVTPLSYITGTLPIADSENVSAHILVGEFGPEIALLVDAASNEDAFTIASTDSLPAQAALYAAAQAPLIGEELFAIPAYLNAGPTHTASLVVQDLLRWGVIVVLLAGAILKLVGIL